MWAAMAMANSRLLRHFCRFGRFRTESMQPNANPPPVAQQYDIRLSGIRQEFGNPAVECAVAIPRNTSRGALQQPFVDST